MRKNDTHERVLIVLVVSSASGMAVERLMQASHPEMSTTEGVTVTCGTHGYELPELHKPSSQHE